jgi:hypothetical protein
MKRNIKDFLVILTILFGLHVWLTSFVIGEGKRGTESMTDCDSVYAEVNDTVYVEVADVAVDSLDVLAHAFAMVESTDNPKAYNKESGASGWLQFKPIMVDEANRIRNIAEGTKGVSYYCYDDRWDKDVSKEMFKVVMRHRNPSGDVRKACVIWNYTHTEKYYNDVVANYVKMLGEI